MLSDSAPAPKSPLRNPLLYSSTLVLVALVGVLFVMLSRWHEASAIEREAARQRAEKQREQDRIAVEQLGGKEFAILDFYANPQSIRRGESAELCYGVSNAKSVKLEPQAPTVWPSQAHCVSVNPKKTTTYTLTIEDAAGTTKSETVDVQVH
jgi:hypothetical protein